MQLALKYRPRQWADVISQPKAVAMLQRLAKPMAEAVQGIARAEGLDGQPIARYVRLMQECGNNMRRALQIVEAGAMLKD